MTGSVQSTMLFLQVTSNQQDVFGMCAPQISHVYNTDVRVLIGIFSKQDGQDGATGNICCTCGNISNNQV